MAHVLVSCLVELPFFVFDVILIAEVCMVYVVRADPIYWTSRPANLSVQGVIFASQIGDIGSQGVSIRNEHARRYVQM
jgi:hypothetical protein